MLAGSSAAWLGGDREAGENYVAKCITCGAELNPERAKKYNYCMSPDCQRKNLRPLEMVAVGVNKSAEQYMLLDERTKEDLASGRYHDQRRGSFGSPAPAAAGGRAPATGRAAPAANPAAGRRSSTASRRTRAVPARPPWTKSQQKLALLYNEQGLRPDEIAAKIGLSRYLVTKIILAAKNGGKI